MGLMAKENLRVLIVDDHPVVRHGLQSLLSQYTEIQVIGEAGDSELALGLIAELQPDVVLLDIRLADESGLSVAQTLQHQHSPVRIIILTSYEDNVYLRKAAQAGVHGYLLKSASAEMLIEAIHAVHRGEHRLSPAVAGMAFEQLEDLSHEYIQYKIGLSEQELHILQLLADGASTQEMCDRLYLSERTIKRKIQDILSKLGAINRTQAVAEAYKLGLL
jgi:DNA-binding NarL/FixJ family response regulator